jgi:histidinol-phosphate aminotransferase
MYKVSAAINNIEVLELPLLPNFNLPALKNIKSKLTTTGLLFICSPNNPTGNSTDLIRIKEIASNFYGLVVVDEAYIDFSESKSAITLLHEIPNLVILQTFSKAYGLAGARVGMAFASPEIIAVLNKIKPPYNISTLNIKAALNVLKQEEIIMNQIVEITAERRRLKKAFLDLQNTIKIYPSNANFLLVQFADAKIVFDALIKARIVVRDRANQIENCLRITIGTKYQNEKLLNILKELEK